MSDRPKVALFATCIVNMMRPNVGFASLKLLEDAGYDVEVPEGQTCCGQPNYNSGDKNGALAAARHFIRTFQDYDYIVAPSGSCAGMVRKHYPALFETEGVEKQQAEEIAGRTYELISFLTDVAGVEKVDASLDANVTYHDSCSGLRELGIKSQPRKLLESVKGLTLTELPDAEICCGFGGLFSVKYPAISNEMVENKVEMIEGTKAECIAMGDVGCLMNIEGKLHRDGKRVFAYHVAEILAGMTGEEQG